MIERLVFVYNADSGPIALLKDIAHKILSPSTYPCSLCSLTYGGTGMRKPWRRFVEGLPVPVDFLHKDELVERYGHTPQPGQLPAAFAVVDGALTEWMDTATLDACADLDALIAAVSARLAA